ncbi:MAG TPA: AtpZ/AtpI family protein [Flavobacteriales bacterium]|nr:AtpZ/AtpI family protein [Flavobacteriales bacterium]
MKLDDGIDKEELEEITGPANSYARYGALGVQMVVAMALFILGGRWLDKTLHTSTPWFTVIGAILGIVGALWFLFKETKRKG